MGTSWKVHLLKEPEAKLLTTAIIGTTPTARLVMPPLYAGDQAGGPVFHIANREAFDHIKECVPWRGSNFWGEWDYHHSHMGPGRKFYYCVYSYRRSWPLLVLDLENRVWCANMETYSRTTTKHMGQTHPEWFRPIWLPTESMVLVAKYGYVTAMARRIQEA